MPSRKDGKKSESDIENMCERQALTLAILCLEFEAENSPKKSAWRSECEQAVKVIKLNYLDAQD